MKLQLVLVEKGIKSKIDLKLLPLVQQKQLKITLNKYYGIKITLANAFAQHSQCDFWRIINLSNPDIPIYDFWIINSDYGIVFNSGTQKMTGVRMIHSMYVSENSDAFKETLCVNLQNAQRIGIDISKFWLDDRNLITDFKSSCYLPDSIAKWRSLLKRIKVSEDFINTYSRYFDKKCWEAIGQNSPVSFRIIRLYGKKLGWRNLSFYQSLSEELIREFQYDVDWEIVSWKQKLSSTFIKEFSEKVNWDEIIKYQNLSIELIKEFKNRIDFHALYIHSEDLVNEFQDENLDWFNVVSNLEGDENFIRKYQAKFDSDCWAAISKHYKLSEEIIEEFESKIDWLRLSENKSLTEDQCIRFKDRIDQWRFSVAGKSVSEELLEEVEQTIFSQK